jgi:hypothetical protein
MKIGYARISTVAQNLDMQHMKEITDDKNVMICQQI